MYELSVRPDLDKIFFKLSKKNPELLRKINNKVSEIRINPNRSYKFLKNVLQSFNRIHIDDHFVMIFKVDHEKQLVELFHFDHHDKAYLWKP